MRAFKMTTINEEISNTSIDENQNGEIINKKNNIPEVKKVKYPFPYSAGIFGMAAKNFDPARVR